MVSRICFEAPMTCINFENLILKSQDTQICAGCLFWQTHCSICSNHGIPQEWCISITAHSSQMTLNLYSMWQEVEKVFPLKFWGDMPAHYKSNCCPDHTRHRLIQIMQKILAYMSAFQLYMKLS